jgi:IS4 transposase
MQFRRFLHNRSVTPDEMAAHGREATATRVAGRDIVVVQDTSELVLGGRRARENGYGPVGKGGALGGLLLHAALAVEAGTGALLGLADLRIWNRTGGKVTSRRSRATGDKESQRWIESTLRSGEILAAARGITSVSDREGDIYEHFARRPANVDLIVRACQNRRLESAEGQGERYLLDFADGLPEQGCFTVPIQAAPGRKARVAELAVRFSPVVLSKPANGASADLPQSIELMLVDVRETSKPKDGELVHWRLLTTHRITSIGAAHRIVDLYRLRWTIEEYFRTLKTAGFHIEEADLSDPRAMMNFVAAAAIAAVTVMQLVKARDGTTTQLLADAFDPVDRPLLEALSAQLEGKTARQKNPHPPGSLAFVAWVIARLGGWTGYYGKPGPGVMREGLDDFQRIKYGSTLRFPNV